MRKLTRRDFTKLTALVGGAAMLPFRFRPALAQIPGGTLDPTAITKYARPLVKPPVFPFSNKIPMPGGKAIYSYELAVRQFQQNILPPGWPATTVWSYGPASAKTFDLAHRFFYPAFTLEARFRAPNRVKWVNGLVDANGHYLPHLLPVDQTLHWANPPGGTDGRDMRPMFDETPGPYTGPVPIVTHLHGAAGVGDESDGYAEAWYLPPASNIPAGFASEGTWYDHFKNKAFTKFGTTWEPGTAVFQYPNDQRAATLWYHDHTLGMTRANVYAGPAGFYLIRGGPSDAVVDGRTGLPAVLPGPAPNRDLNPFGTFYEIPIAIQDRSFNADGSLFYPDSREFFDGYEGPFMPDTPVSPIWNPEFFGNTMVVNGQTWPFLDVEQRRYRFRLLNGCNSRFLILQFDHPAVEVWQIGTEGGFLPAPVDLNAATGGQILLAPAERADVIVDLTNVGTGTPVTLLNVGPDEPFGGGVPGVDFPPADPDTTGQVMELRVGPAIGVDSSTPPQHIVLPAIQKLGPEDRSRRVSLNEEVYEYADIPIAAKLGTMNGSLPNPQGWDEPITENPAVGTTEVWEMHNFTEDAHPIHIHEVHFEVVDREPFGGQPRNPEPWETGLKDTVISYPGEITRVKARFEAAGQFVWHCHIVEHEDNEMMRPYAIGPISTPPLA